MTSVDRIREICKQRKIPLSKLEKDLNFANGYIGQLRKGTMQADRLLQVANYLNVSVDYLLTGREMGNNIFSLENAVLGSRILTDELIIDTLKMYYDLPADKQEVVRDIVKMFYEKEKK